jgi:hypothetical protein
LPNTVVAILVPGFDDLSNGEPKVTGTLEKVGGALFPEKMRRYITFRWLRIFVLVLAAWNIALKLTIKFPPEVVSRMQNQAQSFTRAGFLVPFDIGIAVGFYLIYATRKIDRYYWVRAVAYGMLLGAICGQLIVVFVPFRT